MLHNGFFLQETSKVLVFSIIKHNDNGQVELLQTILLS